MDRVAAARERLSALRRELAVADAYCVDCRYLKASACNHPAAQSHSLNPVTGIVTAHSAPALSVRATEGACGPEADLFEPHALPIAAARAVLSGAGAAWAVVVAGAVVISVLLTGH